MKITSDFYQREMIVAQNTEQGENDNYINDENDNNNENSLENQESFERKISTENKDEKQLKQGDHDEGIFEGEEEEREGQ